MSDLMVNNAMPIMIGLGAAFLACLGLIVFGWFQWRRETNQRLAALSAAQTPTTPMVAPTIEPLVAAATIVPTETATPATPQATAPVVEQAAMPLPAAEAPSTAPLLMADALRLLRDPDSGKLMIEIGGQVFASARDVRRPEHQRLLLGSARDLLIFLGQSRAAAALPAGPAPTETSAETPILPVTPAPAAPLTASAAAQASSTAALRMPSMNPFQQFKVMKAMNATPEAPELTIAQQIDNLLQDLAAVSPLAGHGLRVAGSPDGLVSFELDGHTYGDIDSVPNPAARDLLRAAVKRWEAQAG